MKTILDIDTIAGFFRKLARLPKVWWTQLANSIKRKNCPQVKIVHRKGLDWTIYTRPNGHTKEWEFREIVLNRTSKSLRKYIRTKYPSYLLYLDKSTIKRVRKQINKAIK